MCSQPFSVPVPFLEGQILTGLLTPHKERERQTSSSLPGTYTKWLFIHLFTSSHLYSYPHPTQQNDTAPFHVNIWWPEQNSTLEVRYQVSKAAAFCCNRRMQKARNLTELLLLYFHVSRNKTGQEEERDLLMVTEGIVLEAGLQVQCSFPHNHLAHFSFGL